MKTKFAIGCLVQWYEIKIIKEYVDSLIDALDYHDNDMCDIIVDFTLSLNQDLEKIEGASLEEIKKEYDEAIMELIGKCSLRTYTATEILSIADYRRDFNNKYCEKVDVLVWGESDMLAPKQMFTILDNLHQQVKDKNPKYLGFFSGCKMWDDSWKNLEHPDFTDKPCIEGDTENWWSL